MIKKIFLGLAALIALSSCSGDDYASWLDPQSSEQEDMQTVQATVSPASAVDFANIADESTLVQLFVPQVSAAEGAATEYKVTIYNDDKSKSAELTADENGCVTADALKSAVEAVYGKAPTPRTVQMDIAGYTTIAGITVKSVSTSTISVTLVAPFIDSAYYLTGDMAGWNKDGALAFTHIGDDNALFDNPEFQIVFKTTAANQYWKIIPKTNYDGDFWASGTTGVVGVVTDGDAAMEGSLVTDNPGAGKIEEAGIYRMTINMMEYTYKIEKLNFAPYVYFIGATDGWSASDQKLATTTFDGRYTGYCYVADPNGWGLEFKFQRTAGSWDDEVNSGTFTNGISGDFADGGGNIKATAGEGLYYIEMNLAGGTLKGTKIESMGLVGSFNGWNPADAAQKMTWNATDYCYEITGAGVTASGWKFTANDAWTINLGGDITNLTPDGADLSVVGTTIKLYPTRKTNDNIYCTVE